MPASCRAIVTLLLVSTFAQRLVAQDWDRYKPGSLAAIMAQHEQDVKSQGGPSAPHWALSGDDFPTRARLTYQADCRPLSPERQELLRKWQQAFQVDPKVLDAFHTECRFREGEAEVWVSPQAVLEGALSQEATKGQEITVLATFIGAHYAGGPVTYLFLMNEFDASP